MEYIHVNDNGVFYVFIKTCIFSYFPTNIRACSFSRRRKKMCFPDLQFTRADDKNVLSLMVLIFCSW